MHASRRRLFKSGAPVLALAIGLAFSVKPASADDPDVALLKERCATRLSIAILGKAPDAAMRAATDPQAKVEDLLRTPEFRERFARFVNATFNREPGATSVEDAPYHLAKTVLERDKPWRDLFVGPYSVSEVDGNVVVSDDPEGLGYFRSNAWLLRYAGNEPEGLKISTAYRIAQNTIGLKLTAVTNEPNVDVTAAGRAKQPCASCHKQNWYALDDLAAVLTRKVEGDQGIEFQPPTGGPKQVLGGVSVSNDKELVTALVDSEAFRFRQCRLAFNYLYGRDENKCEGPVFDKCMAAFSAKGTIQSAIAAVASDASFCQ